MMPARVCLKVMWNSYDTHLLEVCIHALLSMSVLSYAYT